MERAASATPLLSTSTMKTAVLRFSSDFMAQRYNGMDDGGGLSRVVLRTERPRARLWEVAEWEEGGWRWRGGHGERRGAKCRIVGLSLSECACNPMCGRPGVSPQEPGRIESFCHATSRQSEAS